MPCEEEIVEIASTFFRKKLFIASCDHHGNNRLHMVMQHGKMLIPKKSSRLIHLESYCKGGYYCYTGYWTCLENFMKQLTKKMSNYAGI
jgi:hypothetical protein